MYIWCGIDVDGQLSDVKRCASEAERELGLEPSCFTLPMHISLKMPFFAEDERACEMIGAVEAFFCGCEAFEIEVGGVADEGNIIWIRMLNNDRLDGIHDELCGMLVERYGIGLHEYDSDYKFHTTLFMSEDTSGMREAYTRVEKIALPARLIASKFIIGVSEDGALGSYKVIKRIAV